ncbi:MAG TPA: SMP-30/gluconolactonase/LRE family protein [Planctomycetaceae bacterium]|nr:SMP-30/gluconolactonase/LRE family protein [Planctomycetaceae bacterium]
MPDLHATPLPRDIVAADVKVAPATTVAFLEGPAADSQGNVFFTDIWNNRILKFDTRSGQTAVWRADSGRANGLLFDAQGRLLTCEGNEFGPHGRRRITRTDIATGNVEVLTERFAGVQYNSPNDIAACSGGRLFFTDPCYGDRSSMQMQDESVYRIDPDAKVTRVITQPAIQRPNGIAISPDEKTLYVVDSCPVAGGNRKIWAFDLPADGVPSRQRLVFDFAPGRGGDGMVVDSRGNLFVAAGIYRPRSPHETDEVPPGIYVITPEGKLVGRIPIPEDVLTNVTFGGDDLKTLYITAGRTLFSIPVAVPGFVVHRRPA